ncbi:hypothetical protein LEP1GSC133_4260 [Leptospira borgpetersenii serovar Pomona str. 200901868]|uniref:Uncharacterized protein n=1 Tax=Leptospira borgpetersenii serovar Pomona str. 200901868 TaxID=1192866 RepID=M6WCI0_LEPBO|nr:hypothetical protein LEP1GSC133_4260 [Leptospira borgpetersenii serovar Pomona str. 200901868]
MLAKSLQGFIRGTASFTVTKFSLLYGISFENVLLKSDSSFEERPVFSVKELDFSYNLPLIFLGRAKLSKIAVIGLQVDLRQKGGNGISQNYFPLLRRQRRKRYPLLWKKFPHSFRSVRI